MDQLGGAHFQRQERHGSTQFRRARAQVQGEGRLADTRTCCKDDQVAAAKAVEQVVNVLEARCYARDLVLLRRHLLQFLEGVDQQRVDARERAGYALLRDREQRFLRLLHDNAQVVGGIVGKRTDFPGCADQIAQDGGALDDLNVILPIDQGERIAGKLQDIRLAANGLKLTRCLQVIGNRNLVKRDMTRVEVEHGLENALVGGSIEVVGDEFCGNILDGLLVKQARC